MSDVLGLGGIGVLVFLVTDVDDLFLLVAFFAAGRHRTWQVVLGQYLGILALISVSAVSYFLRLVVPPVWIGLVGLVPLALGVREAVRVFRRPAGTEDQEPASPAGRGAGVLSVTAVTVSSGGDNLGVYIPLFATSEAPQIVALAAVFLLMTAVWLFLAWGLVHNPLFGRVVRRWGRYLLPVVLVGLGIYILLEQGTIRAVIEAIADRVAGEGGAP